MLVESAEDAENVVRSYYQRRDPTMTGSQPLNFESYKQGYTWIVTFEISPWNAPTEQHEWHIDAHTGTVKSKR